MKNYLFRSFTALSILLFISCSSNDFSEEEKDQTLTPEANFLFTGNNQSAPATINFENTSTNATDYSWDFGDNKSSIEKNPTHIYADPGIYIVKLIVNRPGGTSITVKNITITAPPAPANAG